MHTKKRVFVVLSFVLFLLYFIFLGIFIPFLTSVPLKNGGFKTYSSKKDSYKMVDNYYDPDEFYNFRNSAKNITILSDFYNKLNASKSFNILTSFDQPIDVTNFKGDNSFYYNSEEFIESHASSSVNIKAIQLNKNSYEFYNMKVDVGKDLPWNDISYKNTRIPILLGSNYKKNYHLGDIIRGNYYSKDIDFEVIGFLKNNCSIKYKNISDLNLDTYMIIPYPPNLWNVYHNFQFESLLYFAMINCDIIPFVNETQLLKNIKEIANETGFTNFSLVGIDNFQIQNIELLLFVQKHQIIFIFTLIFLFVLLNIIGTKSFSHITKYVMSPNAPQKKQYNKIFTYYIVLPYGSAFILSLIFSGFFLKKILFISILLECIVLLLTYLIIYICSKKRKKQHT